MHHPKSLFAGFATIATFATALLLPLVASAQAYPNKPVRLIVPFAPAGTTDIVARIVADQLGKELGQTVIVENRGGGGGSIGADVVAKSVVDPSVATLRTAHTAVARQMRDGFPREDVEVVSQPAKVKGSWMFSFL